MCVGVMKKDCPDTRKKKQGNQKSQNGDADVAVEGYDSTDVMCVSDVKIKPKWVLDSGCSFHMCPEKNWFCSYEECNGGQVLLGDNKACKVVGIGVVELRLVDGTIGTLKEVRHVLDLKRNYFSLGMLQRHTCKAKGES